MQPIQRRWGGRRRQLFVFITLALTATAGSVEAQDTSTIELNQDDASLESSQAVPKLRPSGKFASLQGSYPLLPAETHAATEMGVANDTLDLETLRGKLVLLDFWASWCGPCIEKIPETNAFADEFAHRNDFVFVSVNQDALTSGGDLSYVRSFVDDRRIRYPVLIDAAEPSLKKTFKIRAWPTRILISPEGEILKSPTGRLTLSDVADFLRLR